MTDLGTSPGTGSAPSRLSRESLGSQIANALRDEIFAGQLRPGTHLSQQEICDRFGTSRIPVRDALRMLTSEGLVTELGAGRVEVAGLSRRDLEDVFLIEGFLHGLACRRAAERMTDPELEELRTLHQQLADAIAANDAELTADLNWAFHRRINQISGSAKLIAALRPLALSMPRGFLAMVPNWAPKALRMQQRLLAAFAERDGRKAQDISSKHTKRAGAELAAFLAEQGIDLGNSGT